MRDRFILSANATWGNGGQGLNLSHMIEALQGPFDLSVFCHAGQTGVPTRHIPDSRVSAAIGRTPLMRRLRDWQALVGEKHFDAQVSQSLSPAAFFQGTTGQCLDSLSSARAQGSFTILDVVTFHNAHYYAEMIRECARFGIRPMQHSALHRRVLEEYERADAIRVMSEPARRSFLERGCPEEKVFVASPPFDVSQFPQADFRGSRFTVTYVGMLEPAKGFHYLIEAFRGLNNPDADLILRGNTGARPLARYLGEQMAACPTIQIRPEPVRQVGFGKVYGASSVLVHPSLSDGFGYVVGEAMASGIPVITTPVTGASQYVVDGVNGYVVPPRDPGAIRERLEYLMNQPALLREMGKAARETISQLTLKNFQSCMLEGIAVAKKSAIPVQ